MGSFTLGFHTWFYLPLKVMANSVNTLHLFCVLCPGGSRNSFYHGATSCHCFTYFCRHFQPEVPSKLMSSINLKLNHNKFEVKLINLKSKLESSIYGLQHPLDPYNPFKLYDLHFLYPTQYLLCIHFKVILGLAIILDY